MQKIIGMRQVPLITFFGKVKFQFFCFRVIVILIEISKNFKKVKDGDWLVFMNKDFNLLFVFNKAKLKLLTIFKIRLHFIYGFKKPRYY